MDGSSPVRLGGLLVLLLLVPASACGGDGGGLGGDGGGPADDAVSCAYVDGGVEFVYTILGSVPSGGGCVGCGRGVEGDPMCQAAYPDGPSECEVLCKDSSCIRICPGQGCWYPDAGACEVGSQACQQPWGLNVCEPTCGEAGGCRLCYFDEQCQAELGPEAHCQRHCGTCCRPADDSGGPYPCACA